MAQQLIDSLSSEFDPSSYHDQYREKVLELIEKKASGEEIAVQPEAPEPAQGAGPDGRARGEPRRGQGRRAARRRRSTRPSNGSSKSALEEEQLEGEGEGLRSISNHTRVRGLWSTPQRSASSSTSTRPQPEARSGSSGGGLELEPARRGRGPRRAASSRRRARRRAAPPRRSAWRTALVTSSETSSRTSRIRVGRDARRAMLVERAARLRGRRGGARELDVERHAAASSSSASGRPRSRGGRSMRVISNTRWTVSVPADQRERRPAAAQRAVGERDQPQPARVHELEPAQVEHDARARSGSPASRSISSSSAAAPDRSSSPVSAISASPALVSVVWKARGATSTSKPKRPRNREDLGGWLGCAAPTAPAPVSGAPRRGRGFELPRRGRRPDRGARGRRAHPRAGDPAGLEGRLDLPVAARPPPGDRRRRRRPQAVPLPRRTGAPGATPRSSTRCSTSPRDCRRCASASRPTSRRATSSTRERVLACAVRLLDRGFFRIGSEEYAEQNESYGLATMRKAHVTLEDDGHDGLRLPRQERQAPGPARSSTRWRSRSSATLKRRRGGGEELLAYKEGRRWRDIALRATSTSTSRTITGGDFSAKDFRTWNATVLAAVALAVAGEVAGDQDRPQAGDHARGQGGRPLPRQHAGGLPRLLHRPARVRRLRGRADHRARRCRRPPRAAAASCRSTSAQLERAVLDLIDEREAAPGVEKIAA